MTDPFAKLVGPFFDYVVDLLHRIEAGEQPPFQAEHDKLRRLLVEADQAAQSEGLEQDWALARAALVYWADALLTDSKWQHPPKTWRDYILEFPLYGERMRAARFPQKADAAFRLQGSDALETFYVCAATGYSGWCIDGRPDGQEEFLRWGREVYAAICKKIADNGVQPAKFLVGKAKTKDRSQADEDDDEEEGNAPLEPLPGKSILLAASVLVSITVLITLACFVLAFPPWES